MGDSPRIVEMLLQCTANKEWLMNYPSSAEGNTPLHLAAQKNNVGIMKVLMSYGANANIKNNMGVTAAEITANHPGNREHAIKYLAEKAAGQSAHR